MVLNSYLNQDQYNLLINVCLLNTFMSQVQFWAVKSAAPLALKNLRYEVLCSKNNILSNKYNVKKKTKQGAHSSQCCQN